MGGGVGTTVSKKYLEGVVPCRKALKEGILHILGKD